MLNRPAMVMCCRVKDRPAGINIIGTIKRLCAKCGEQVLVAPSSRKLLRENPLVVIICNQCAEKEFAGGKPFVPVVTLDALAEVEAIEKSKGMN